MEMKLHLKTVFVRKHGETTHKHPISYVYAAKDHICHVGSGEALRFKCRELSAVLGPRLEDPEPWSLRKFLPQCTDDQCDASQNESE